ncbi:glycosyltransferase family 2 protein [Aerosakkonema funiforme]|uniref:glycosyltransferase family 2 protein n=1 Tax=Aerosakkonema funiforme TaxID=1246630 RepID=UPI0035BA2CF5
MNHVPLAILIACYNRRDQTLKCLQALYEQNVSCDVYLVDDASSDGTSDAVRANYPTVKLIQGKGNLFWGGGMRLAFSEALKVGYDYYLWLNDDTTLEADAIAKLLDTHHKLASQGYPNSIVVGSTRDPVTKKPTYGGQVRYNRWRRLKFKLVEPGEQPQQCQTMNGNCVLIPAAVAEKVGNIDDAFPHQLGDYDYGLRARQKGCLVWIAPGYIGTCSRNSYSGSWKDSNQPLAKRLEKVFSLKGMEPREWKIYTKRHGGIFWYLYWIFPYLRVIISSVFKQMDYSSTEL